MSLPPGEASRQACELQWPRHWSGKVLYRNLEREAISSVALINYARYDAVGQTLRGGAAAARQTHEQR